jgi:hypothetical protein
MGATQTADEGHEALVAESDASLCRRALKTRGWTQALIRLFEPIVLNDVGTTRQYPRLAIEAIEASARFNPDFRGQENNQSSDDCRGQR